jgi:hypothetical protein
MAYRVSYVVWTVRIEPVGDAIWSHSMRLRDRTDNLKLPVMSIEKNETPVFLHLRDRYSLGV